MEIQINYLNNDDNLLSEAGGEPVPTWHSRWKTYKSDEMDEDMKVSIKSRSVDRIIINDAQLSTKKSIDDMIEFLNNSRESFKY